MAINNFSLTKIKVVLANLNAILLFIGYTFYTSLIFGVEENIEADGIRVFSIFYRAFALLVALLVILLTFNYKRLKNQNIKLFFLIWFLFSCRILFDLFIRDSEISQSNTNYLFQIIFGGFLIPTIAIYKSRDFLDLKIIFKFTLVALLFVVSKGVILNSLLALVGVRANMNIAQSTLTFGSFSGALFLYLFCILKSNNVKRKIKMLSFLLLPISIMGIVLAGSRGPLFGVFFTLLITNYSKNLISSIKFSIFIILFVVIFGNIFISQVEYYAPLMYQRVYDTVVLLSLGGRESVFEEAITQMFENPFLGDWFLLDRSDRTSIAHNALLQAGMSIGVFGLILNAYLYWILLKNSIKLINLNSIYSLWGYLTIYYIIYSLTTGGAIFFKYDFNFAFLILLIISAKSSKLNNQVFKTN